MLPQVVPSVTPDAARGLFHKSREDGVAVVIVTVKVNSLWFHYSFAHIEIFGQICFNLDVHC